MVDSWKQRLDDPEAAVYPIGVVADLLGVSVQVIRRYDEQAVVEPQRSEGGQRRYSRQDIARLVHVLELAEEGNSPAGIRRILGLEAQLARYRAEADGEGPTSQEPGSGEGALEESGKASSAKEASVDEPAPKAPASGLPVPDGT